MEPTEIAAYIMFATLLIIFLSVSGRRRRKWKETAVAELKEEFFPQLIANLKALDKRLGEEEVGGEGYVELLDRGRKSTLILNFHKYYGREEETYASLKQDLEGYEEEVREWKKTEDERLREKMVKRKMRIRENLTKLIKKLEKLT